MSSEHLPRRPGVMLPSQSISTRSTEPTPNTPSCSMPETGCGSSGPHSHFRPLPPAPCGLSRGDPDGGLGAELASSLTVRISTKGSSVVDILLSRSYVVVRQVHSGSFFFLYISPSVTFPACRASSRCIYPSLQTAWHLRPSTSTLSKHEVLRPGSCRCPSRACFLQQRCRRLQQAYRCLVWCCCCHNSRPYCD